MQLESFQVSSSNFSSPIQSASISFTRSKKFRVEFGARVVESWPRHQATLLFVFLARGWRWTMIDDHEADVCWSRAKNSGTAVPEYATRASAPKMQDVRLYILVRRRRNVY